MKKHILVYNGEGVSDTSLVQLLKTLDVVFGRRSATLSAHYQIKLVSAIQLSSTLSDWESETELLIIPGGRDLPYLSSLQSSVPRLTKWIEEKGGKYLGICAGGYFGAESIEFEKGREGYEVTGKRLGFWPSKAIGTLFPLKEGVKNEYAFHYGSESGAQALDIFVPGNGGHQTSILPSFHFKCYYNGGCYFRPALSKEKDCHSSSSVFATSSLLLNSISPFVKVNREHAVLAYYVERHGQVSRKLPKDPYCGSIGCLPAIVSTRFVPLHDPIRRTGIAILSGVHFEYDSEWSKEEVELKSSSLQDELEKTKFERFYFMKWLFEDILLMTTTLSSMIETLRTTSSNSPISQLTRLQSMTEIYNQSKQENLIICFMDEKVRLERLNAFDSLIFKDQNIVKKSENLGQASYSFPGQISLHFANEPPLSSFFDINLFFTSLKLYRERFIQGQCGSTLIYSDLVSSTQTILERSSELISCLPTGTVFIASHQVSGKGRSNTSWLSALGCLQFTLIWKMDPSSCSPVLFQYYVSLSLIEAIHSEPGYEKLSLYLKWPNDIYYVDTDLNASNPVWSAEVTKYKLSGVLIQSHLVNNLMTLLIGIGFNVDNSFPTASLNDVIRIYNDRHQTNLPLWSREQLLSKFLLAFDHFVNQFTEPSNGFSLFEREYYKKWMHSDQVLKLESGEKVKLIGVHPYGYLRAQLVDFDASMPNLFSSLYYRLCTPDSTSKDTILLQPGNTSLDMMEGLIKYKSS